MEERKGVGEIKRIPSVFSKRA
jgi:hypothetical protein